jgi:hypothetical protein
MLRDMRALYNRQNICPTEAHATYATEIDLPCSKDCNAYGFLRPVQNFYRAAYVVETYTKTLVFEKLKRVVNT